MINHLINDMHIYDEVCLNVGDIQELKLLRLPATFHQSKAKLYSIDPCLLDIRLSPSDQLDAMSSREANNGASRPSPIARRSRGESIGSIGSSALALSSSNGSSSSLDIHQSMEAFPSFSSTETNRSKPVTLLAKKVLPRKIERPTRFNPANPGRKPQTDQHQRRTSPIRVTITSKLNPDALPFFVQQQSLSTPLPNSSIKFYEHPRFRSQQPPGQHQQPMPTNVYRTHQRFIPPRHMARNPIPPLIAKNTYPVDARFHPHPSSYKSSAGGSSIDFVVRPRELFVSGSMSRPSPPPEMIKGILSANPIRECLSVPSNTGPRLSSASLHSTNSLPYQQGHSAEPMASRRGPRTVSGTSSGSSLSVDIGPHSIVQFDSSTVGNLTTTDGQYDFEKANEEFRRYLELEQLVTRRASSGGSTGSSVDPQLEEQTSPSHSYNKEVSFFDRISCTATTGTAVGYTEMDELEKNRQTFGDDALLANSDSNDDGENDDEWRI